MDNIAHYIRSNEKRFIKELASLVRQPSNSKTGEGIEKCASVLKDLMEKSGVKARVMPTDGSPVVYGVIMGAKHKVTLLL